MLSAVRHLRVWKESGLLDPPAVSLHRCWLTDQESLLDVGDALQIKVENKYRDVKIKV